MINENLNISKIESFLYGIIKDKVSKNTFIGTLPDTTDQRWNDMCLIDCGNSINDLCAFGNGTVLIWLYAKPLSNGCKNVKKMFELENKLNAVIDKSLSADYAINRRNSYQDYDSKRKWHCNIVELNIIIS